MKQMMEAEINTRGSYLTDTLICSYGLSNADRISKRVRKLLIKAVKKRKQTEQREKGRDSL